MLRAVSRLLCATLLVGASACATKQAATVKPSPTDTTARAESPAPDTASDAAADAEAEAARALVPPTLYYSLDSSQLTPESQQQLAALAQALRSKREVGVDIAGHTCELGTSEYNLILGQQRAARARDFLVTMGVEASRVSTVSYGEESPAVEGEEEEARAKNRRAEVRVARSGQR